jgi:hypothetical protein
MILEDVEKKTNLSFISLSCRKQVGLLRKNYPPLLHDVKLKVMSPHNRTNVNAVPDWCIDTIARTVLEDICDKICCARYSELIVLGAA